MADPNYVYDLLTRCLQNFTDELEKEADQVPPDDLLRNIAGYEGYRFSNIIADAGTRGNMRVLRWMQKIGLTFADHKSVFRSISFGAAKGGQVVVWEWLREKGADGEFYNYNNFEVILLAAKHGQTQLLTWYKSNFVKNDADWARVSWELLNSSVQLGYIKTLLWLEQQGKVNLRHADHLITHTMSAGNIEALKWLQKMGVGFNTDFEGYHALSSLVSMGRCPKHRACDGGNERLAADMKAGLDWLDSMGMTAAHWNYHKTHTYQRNVLVAAVGKNIPVLNEWCASRMGKEDFAEVGKLELWRQIQRQKALIIVLADRRKKSRRLPPEVWEQCVAPLVCGDPT